MERGKGLWKRIASLILSLAMVLTLMPTQFAYAAGEDDAGSSTDELPETLMYFSFDDNITDGDKVTAEIVTGSDGKIEHSTDVKRVGDGALYLQNPSVQSANGSYLQVPAGALANEDGSGKTALTISYWSKAVGSNLGWTFFAATPDIGNHYIGILDNTAQLRAECFNGTWGKAAIDANGSASSEWKHVTVVITPEFLKLFVNGENVGEKTTASGEMEGLTDLSEAVFYIGHATWGSGEGCSSYIDELTVYDGALTNDQAEALGKRAVIEDALEKGFVDAKTVNLGVGKTTTITPISSLPTSVAKQVTYESTDEGVATVDDDGEVIAVGAGTATIKAYLRYDGVTHESKQSVTINVKGKAEELVPVSEYKFDVPDSGDAPSLGSGVELKASPNNTGNDDLIDYEEDAKFVPGRSGQSDDYAVDTEGNHGIVLPDEQLGENYTVSFWVKPNDVTKMGWATSLLFVGRAMPTQKWVSICSHWNKNGDVTCWSSGMSQDPCMKVESGKWQMITVAQSGVNAEFYLNGVKVYEKSGFNKGMEDADQFIALATNHWDGNYNGVYDDVYVYNTALSANQVKTLYLKDADVNTLGMLAKNESYDFITSDLTLPETFMGFDLTWVSDESAKISADGKVSKAALDGSEVTLTASTEDEELGFNWSKDYTLRLAKPITINFVDENGTTVRTDTEYGKVGTKYTYEVKENMFSTADAAYKYDEEGNGETDFTVEVTEEGTQTITVKYKKMNVGSVDFSQLPDTVYMIEGNKAYLPKTVKGTVSADDGTEQQPSEGDDQEGADSTEIDVPILWDDYSELEPGEHTLNGSAAGFKCSVKLHVFACDESVEDAAASNSNQKIKFENGYKGVIETEYDIEMTGELGADSLVAYFDQGVADDADTFWQSSTSTRFTGGKFFVNGGNGNGGNADDSESTDYPATADRTIVHDGTSTYHVRTRIDTTGVTFTPGTEATEEEEATDAVTVGNGTYRVWVTDPNGNTVEVTDPQNPMTFRKVATGIIDKVGAARAGFKVTNHKISWQSGYASRTVEIYLGEDTTPEKTMTRKLLPSSLLGEAAVTAYGYQPATHYVKDGVTYNRDMEKSGWYQGTTKITQAEAIEAAVAGATVIYRAYYATGIADFAGLQDVVDAAKDLYDDAVEANIYAAESLKSLQDEIAKAEALLATQGTAAPAASAEVDKAIADLTALVEKGLELKDLEELNGSMAAYYPLTADAKDATDNGLDGEVHGSLKFNRSKGATFPGSTPGLTNYIELSKDMDITDQMTFSFWAYTENGGGNNVFGLGSGHTMSTSNHFSIYTSNGASLSANGGKTGYTGPVGVTGIEYNANEWHLVTCVVNGTNLVFYVDGVKKEEGTIGVALEEAWEAHPEEQHIYVGNCMYAWNGNGAYDADYKGNVKYLRIYNASLAAEQVKDIYDSEVDAQLEVAALDLADELLAEPGEGANEGKYTMLITDENITLPDNGPQGEVIRWEAVDSEGEESELINVDTGAVTLPATGTTNVTLKASIRLNKKSKVVDILCTLKTLSAEAKAARTALQSLLKEANQLVESEYTSASWASFETILSAAKAAYSSASDNMAAQKTALENAMKTDGTGTLEKRGDKSALNTLLARAQRALDGALKDDYDEDVWAALEEAIAEAEELSDDVSQAVVDDAKDKLQTAYDAFKPKTYDKAQAEALAADAKKLLEGKNEYEYDEKVWADLQNALAAVEALTDQSTVAQTTAAYKNLKAAMDAFEPKTIDKEALGTLAADTKKELEGLNKADYDPKAWAAVEVALAEVEQLPADADEATVKAAYGKLWNALKTLKASPFVAVSSVTLSKTSLTLAVKQTATLTATVNPSNATDQTKTWKSSNAKVATVVNGKITAIGKGTANITVTAGGKTATCKVTVTVPVSKITISATYKNVAAGKKTTLKANVTPSTANNKAVTWSTSNKKYATVTSKGVVTTKKAGAGKTVTITATAKDGSKKKGTIKIKILKNAVTKVTLKAKATKVKAGKKVTVKATVRTNGKKVNKTLAWKSSNTKYATVSKKGVVTTKKAGKGKTVTITATSTDGTKKSAKVKIKITK